MDSNRNVVLREGQLPVDAAGFDNFPFWLGHICCSCQTQAAEAAPLNAPARSHTELFDEFEAETEALEQRHRNTAVDP